MSLENKQKLRRLCLVLFIIYIIVIVYFLIFSDQFGRGGAYDERRYNLHAFKEIRRFIENRNCFTNTSVMLNLIGNVAAFVPFGMLIRWGRNKPTGFLVAFCYSFGFSLCIETVQFITRLGVFDVDDIIMNTIGGMLGFVIYKILATIDKKR